MNRKGCGNAKDLCLPQLKDFFIKNGKHYAEGLVPSWIPDNVKEEYAVKCALENLNITATMEGNHPEVFCTAINHSFFGSTRFCS
jgi:hypothetical protein